MDIGRRRGAEGELYGESNIDTHSTTGKTDNQWEFVYDSGSSNRGSAAG